MSSDDRNSQSKEQLLYTMLCSLVKKNDGEIRIKESLMDSITKYDNMLVYHDKTNKEVILTLHLLDTSLQDEIF